MCDFCISELILQCRCLCIFDDDDFCYDCEHTKQEVDIEEIRKGD
jgi:hypothetical protein